jgi:hypothetical protein
MRPKRANSNPTASIASRKGFGTRDNVFVLTGQSAKCLRNRVGSLAS